MTRIEDQPTVTSLGHCADSTATSAALEQIVPIAVVTADTNTATAVRATRMAAPAPAAPREIGGREGLEPTRYGDWELRGRCIDF